MTESNETDVPMAEPLQEVNMFSRMPTGGTTYLKKVAVPDEEPPVDLEP